jgi:hypothetical protein
MYRTELINEQTQLLWIRYPYGAYDDDNRKRKSDEKQSTNSNRKETGLQERHGYRRETGQEERDRVPGDRHHQSSTMNSFSAGRETADSATTEERKTGYSTTTYHYYYYYYYCYYIRSILYNITT